MVFISNGLDSLEAFQLSLTFVGIDVGTFRTLVIIFVTYVAR